MLKYLEARPLLLCGIICAVIAFGGYFSFIGAVVPGLISIALAFLFFKNKKHLSFVLCLGLCVVMAVSSVVSYFKISQYKNFPKIETAATVTLCEKKEGDGYFSGVFQVIDCKDIERGVKLYGFFKSGNIEVGDVAKVSLIAYATKDEYRLSNFCEGVYLTANINSCEKTGKTDFVLKAIESVKTYIKKTLFLNLERAEASTLSALIFGEKQYFDSTYETAVRRAGVSHVMVVSGMHLSISVLFFAGLLSRIWYNRFVKAFTMLSVVLVLTSVCGFSVSILRAGITYIIAAIMLMLNRNSLSENNLGGAVAIILIVNPLMVFSGAFWLSVLSTFGILCVAKYFLAALQRTRLYYCTVLSVIISAAVITVSATLLTLPVTIYLFGEISLVGVMTNLLISYAVTISLWLSITGVFVSLILPVVAKGLFVITEPIVAYVNSVITYFGELKYATVTVPKETAFLALALIVAVFWGILHLSERKYYRLLKEKGIKTEKEIKKNKGKEGFKINV